MTSRPLTGTRIRDRRIDRGLRQTDLATAVGISPSYLNLIEHNSRRIGGKLLLDIARALTVDPAHLSDGAEYAVIDALRAAAAAEPGPVVEQARVEDFLGRFPGWAALITAQARRIGRLEAQVAELSDRLTHDPELATSLHQVITAVTAIRSTSSILVSDDRLDRDWQDRFHRNIYDDSVKLAESSRMLIKYLEEPGEAKGITHSPQEEVGRYLDAIGFHEVALEGGDPDPDLSRIVADAAARVPGIAIPSASSLLTLWLERYRDDARAMPIDPFSKASIALNHDPTKLARRFGVGLAAVLRRLATLPPGQDHPPMGLAICDAAGALLQVKRIPGFLLSRVGAGCPLWPLYQALAQPGRGIRTVVALPGDRAPRFECFAVAGPRIEPGFDEVPVTVATMLVRAAPADTTEPRHDLPVGLACRICPRSGCAARREPSILG